MCNSDNSREWVRINYINVGRRPTCIKRIGYYDWTLGNYFSRGGDKFEKVLKEGDNGFYDIEIKFKDNWKIKTFFIEDYFENRWIANKHQMKFLYDSAHKYTKDFSKQGVSFIMQREDSMKKYLKFIDKKKYSNNTEVIRIFRNTGRISD